MRSILFATLLAAALISRAAETAPEEARLIKDTRQLTFEGKRAGEGYFHPDGNLLVFQSEREEGNPFYQIYLLDLLSGESARVSPGAGKTTCAFFQPGTSRLLFASTHHDAEAPAKQKAELDFRATGKQRRYAWDYDPAYDIFACQQDGTQLQQLTDAPGYDAEASYSPDGNLIVFCSTRAAFPAEKLSPEDRARFEKDPAYFGDLYVMNADGSGVRRLTDAPGYDGGPFFSPDGERIVWRRFDAHGMNADIFTMRTDGTDVRRITDFKSMSWAPFYHPGGNYIVFTSNKLGFENFELFLVDAAGEREPVRATFTGGFDGLPVFSPDGRRLCWTSNRTGDGRSQLFLAHWNHPAAVKALDDSPRRARTPEEIAAAEEKRKREQEAAGEQERALAPLPAKAAPAIPGGAKLDDAITVDDLRAQVAWLAAPEREGRMTGSPGAKAAARFLADYFRALGLQPLGADYLVPFEFRAGERLIEGRNSLQLTAGGEGGAQTFELDKGFRPLAFTENGEAEGEVVFAGYGLSVPEGKGNGAGRYASYEGLDVKDKVVLVLRYVPEGVDPQRRAQLNRYAGLRYKAMMARERGAKAVLFVSGPNSAQPGELLPLAGDNASGSSGIIAASITGAAADALLAPSGKTLKALQTALDTENPHADGGFLLPKVRVRIATGVEHLRKTDHNVVALLPAAPAPAPAPAERGEDEPKESGPHGLGHGGKRVAGEEFLVVGAHYDHLGLGSPNSSMARSGEEGKIHVGADDNASGVAVVMELAAALARERAEHPERFRRGIVFALWSGEEIGVIGSASFADKPPVDVRQLAAYVNFDMVGRLRDNRLTLQGIASSRTWRRLIEKRNVAAGFNLTLQDDPYLPTDTTSFYPKRIPVLNFFTGAHDDYHRPTDTPDKINYEGTERIATFARGILLDLAGAPERPDFARVEKSSADQGSRETLRAYLGTIPDYTTEAAGVKIAGTRGGSPAEKAGLQGGDVLVEFAGQQLKNIYDYTYALDAVKIGQPVKVVVLRGGQRVELTVTPEARK